MNTYLAWLYANKDVRLREVPVSERSGSRRFGVYIHSGVAKVSGAPVQRYVPGPLDLLVQIGVVNFKEVWCMHLDIFRFGNGISRIRHHC